MIFIIQENIEANLSIHKNENFKITDINHEIIAPFNTDLKFSNEINWHLTELIIYKGLINQRELSGSLSRMAWNCFEPKCHAKLNFNVNGTPSQQM